MENKNVWRKERRPFGLQKLHQSCISDWISMKLYQKNRNEFRMACERKSIQVKNEFYRKREGFARKMKSAI